MRIINVIEIVNSNVDGIYSFGIFEDQLSQDVIDIAEAKFKSLAVENGCIFEDDDEEWNDILSDGFWENGIYSINIVWSYI